MITTTARHPRPSSLRRLRKRYRQKLAEATAHGPKLLGGWGTASPRDLLLIREAIRDGWETPHETGAAIIREIVDGALHSDDGRLVNATVRVCLAAAAAEQRGQSLVRRRRAVQ